MTKRKVASVVEDNRKEKELLNQGVHKIEQRNTAPKLTREQERTLFGRYSSSRINQHKLVNI